MLFTHTFQFHQFLIYEYINWIYQWNQPKCISFQIKHSISIAWSLIYILPCVWLFDLHTFGFWFSHHCLTATKISLCHCRLSYFLPNFLKKVHFVPWFRITSKWENIYAWSWSKPINSSCKAFMTSLSIADFDIQELRW